MSPILFHTIFHDAFDTFKAFDNLTVAQAGEKPAGAPSTIWQILHHLMAWQHNQLEMLKGNQPGNIEEQETWIGEEHPVTQKELDEATARFHKLTTGIETEIKNFDSIDAAIANKLKIIQELSIHVSFHVGEVVLMRRMAGNYPMPGDMSAFLNQ